MGYLSQLFFLILFSGTILVILKRIRDIRRNINLGKATNRYEKRGERIKNMVLMAFGQKKMFHKPIVAFLHLFVYLGFLIVNIEILEIIIDGLLGSHRIFLSSLGSFYPVFISIFEFFAVAVIVSCAIFLIRRNIIHIRRFSGKEMTSWPKTDANIILTAEILLMLAFLTMNASDTILQTRGFGGYHHTGAFFFSSFLAPLLTGFSSETLRTIERFGWWFHIMGVFSFAIYVFQNSKHLHIFLAFPNTYFAQLKPLGYWENMPSVTKEVKLMLNLETPDPNEPASEVGRFGAKDVQDLSWKNLLDAYACTECGRCTSNCPANITGKKLSPRKIMMDTRDRLEEVGKGMQKNGKDFQDGKALLGDYITDEEIMACTTCNACVEACPVLINPLDIIIQLRRYKIMEEAQAPASWNTMFANIENNFAPWKFSPTDRANWKEKLD